MILEFGKVDKSGGTEPRSPISITLIFVTAFLAGVGLSDALAQDIAEKAQLCDACHGEDGKPKEPDTPIIWGQYTGYLYIELRDYKSGLRKNDKMSPIAADLSKDDMMALAQYFSEKKWPQLDTSASNADALASERIAAYALRCSSVISGAFTTLTSSFTPATASPRPARSRPSPSR